MTTNVSEELGVIEFEFNRASDELVAWVTGPGILIPDPGVSISSRNPEQRNEILSNIRRGISVHDIAIEACERRLEAGRELLGSKKILFKSMQIRRWNEEHERIILRMIKFRSELIDTYTSICDELGLN
jgi:hypothetical protein